MTYFTCRYSTHCAMCHAELFKGQTVFSAPPRKAIYCQACGKRHEMRLAAEQEYVRGARAQGFATRVDD